VVEEASREVRMGTVFKRGEFWYYNLRNEYGKRMRLFQELTTPWYLMPISMLAVYTGMRRGDDNLIGGGVGLQ
jgi:hypothetical protein